MPKPITKTPWATTYQDQAVTLPDNSPALAPNKTQAPLSIQDSGVLYHEPLASNWLNFQLNETYQWIDYFEEVTDGPDPIDSSWAQAKNEYLKKDLSLLSTFDLSAETNGTSIFVSPTGGGGTVWDALDDLPLETKYIIIRVDSSVTANSGADNLYYYVSACDYLSDPSDAVNRIDKQNLGNFTSGTGLLNALSSCEVRIPVDQRRFRLQWDYTIIGSTFFSAGIDVALVGYGV
jgi:hypothetical protein